MRTGIGRLGPEDWSFCYSCLELIFVPGWSCLEYRPGEIDRADHLPFVDESFFSRRYGLECTRANFTQAQDLQPELLLWLVPGTAYSFARHCSQPDHCTH